MSHRVSSILAIVALSILTGCQPSLVGTWESVRIDHAQPPEPPIATSMRLALTPVGDAFILLRYDTGNKEVWYSKYHTEGDKFFAQFLFEEQPYRYSIENDQLTIEDDEIKVIFQRVRAGSD